MRWLTLILFLSAFTPIHTQHKNLGEVDQEFKNVEQNLQSQQLIVFNSTPILTEMKDGQVAILSTGAFVRLLFRQNEDIYSINVSCVTIRR